MNPPVMRGLPVAVTVSGLSKRFGNVAAVEDVSFTVGQGETLVLWGPNGAGKTTILRCLLGIVPFEGDAVILGTDVRRRGKAARRLIGYVPQEIRLPPDQTAREAIQFYAALRRVPSARADTLLAEWGLCQSAGQPVRHLSGGMKQKLALAIALLSDPPVLLLDEPTSNLDVDTRREFSLLLDRLQHAGKTLVCCSHRVGEVWKLADRVVVLRRGLKIAEGPPSDIAVHLQDARVLCLTVPRDRIDEAVAVLSRHGFAVQRNGMQLWVNAAEGRKVAPIQLVLDAEIPLFDFEIT